MKLFSQEKKLISLIINQDSLNNGFAGEKIMLVKKNNQYVLIRKILRSGIPVIAEIKYQIKLINDNQLEAEKIINNPKSYEQHINDKYIIKLDTHNTLITFLNDKQIQRRE